MANPRHLAKLLEGVDAWNKWRKGKEMKAVDLSQLNLSGRDFSGANFNFANFHGSICIKTNFAGADFHNANLSLIMAAQADFTRADFFGAKLDRATLWDANLSGSRFGFSSVCDTDLQSVKGLDSISHTGGSTIGVDTIYLSKGKIPASFLRGCGLPQEFIDYIPALLGAIEPIELYSVFISYASKDTAFSPRDTRPTARFIEDNIVLCVHRLLHRHADCCPPSPAARNRPLRGSHRASSQASFPPAIRCRRW